MGENDAVITFLMWAMGIIIGLLLLGLMCTTITEFKSELRYLNTEIHRTEGRERKHYIRRRRRLWLSLLPFVKY